jgi:hypothetical protein
MGNKKKKKKKNIIMDLKVKSWEDGDWIQLTQDMDQ